MQHNAMQLLGLLAALLSAASAVKHSSIDSKAHFPSCKCNEIESTAPFRPPGAMTGPEAASLPACYQDPPPSDYSTFRFQFPNVTQCFAYSWSSDLVQARTCLTRKDPSKTAIFLLGDSHARSLEDGLVKSTYKEVLPALWISSPANEHVLDLLEPILKEQLKANDVVWFALRMGGIGGGQMTMPPHDVESYGTLIPRIQRIAQEKGAKLVLVNDWPTLGGRPAANRWTSEASLCYLKHKMGQFPTACLAKFEDVQAGRQGISSVMSAAEKNGAYVFNASKFFCINGQCDYNVPNRTVSAYFDYGHLNPAGSFYLSPFICSFMKDNGFH